VWPCFPLKQLAFELGFGLRWFLAHRTVCALNGASPYKPLPGESSGVFEFTIGTLVAVAPTPGRDIHGFPLNYMEDDAHDSFTLIGLVIANRPDFACTAEEVKLGYVDLRRALHETEDGAQGGGSLKKVFDIRKQKELDETAGRRQERPSRISNKKRTLLPADTVRQKEAELQERVAKVQQRLPSHQQDLAATEESHPPSSIACSEHREDRYWPRTFTMILDKKPGRCLRQAATWSLTKRASGRYNRRAREKGPLRPRAKGKAAAAQQEEVAGAMELDFPRHRSHPATPSAFSDDRPCRLVESDASSRADSGRG